MTLRPRCILVILCLSTELAEARELLRRVQRRTDRSGNFLYLGQIAQVLNEDERAVELFKQAIALAPSYSLHTFCDVCELYKAEKLPGRTAELELSIK